MRPKPRAYRPHLSLVACCLSLSACAVSKAPTKVSKPVPVAVASVSVRHVPLVQRYVGQVDAYRSVELRARVAGELTRVHFQQGQLVSKGDLLITIDPSQYRAKLAQAKADLETDLVKAGTANRELKRYTQLFNHRSISPQLFDEKVKEANALESTIQAERAEVELAQLNLDYCFLHAPVTGVVGEYLVDEGNLVDAYQPQPLAVVRQIEPIYVNFAIPERRLPSVFEAMSRGTLPVTAVINNTLRERGVLTFRDNTVDPATGTLMLQATFANADRHLWPGQFVDVYLTLEELPDAHTIPFRAVMEGPKGPYVFVVDGKRVAIRTIQTGERLDEGENVVVSSGLKPGETVVVRGQLSLSKNTEVAVVERTEVTDAIASTGTAPTPAKDPPR
ncbi:Multidrug resistance protein MdtA precursor [Planctomycetes bacterium Pan216]|uniref:Multidrug resistance protein MdtA n=1 Tax=Kolteria novifilia TaxID=2527975 RepID=A0A518B5X6_9BACT|nr:Multidrug resistance protein MdtA precursor [Planctomycetes bacterium Pan216]